MEMTDNRIGQPEHTVPDTFTPQLAFSLLADEEIIEELKKRGYKVLKQTTKWEEV